MKHLVLSFPGLQNIFWKICKILFHHPPTLPPPPFTSYMVNIHSLNIEKSEEIKLLVLSKKRKYALGRYQNLTEEEKIKNKNMTVNNIRISQTLKSIGKLSAEKR